MDTQTLAAEADPLAVPAERLYRVPGSLYRELVAHRLIDPDAVSLDDGLLVRADVPDCLYRMSLEAYHRVAELGLLDPDDRTELVDGLLVTKLTRRPSHESVTGLTNQALQAVLPAGWFIRKEAPVTLPAGPRGSVSEPEPDLAVVRGQIRDYLSRHPVPADIALVVEVSESTLRWDRNKLTRYAWAGVPTAWIVNLNENVIEVHTRPSGAEAPAGYREVAVYRPGEHVAVTVDGREAGRVAVADLLP